MKYHYKIYNEWLKDRLKNKDSSRLSATRFWDFINNHLFDQMFNELALKPRSELPQVIAFLRAQLGLVFEEMANNKYYKSDLNQLTPGGYKLVKLCDVIHRIEKRYIYKIQPTSIKHHLPVIKEFFPVLERFFGVDITNSALKTAAFSAYVRQNYDQYAKEIELIYSGLDDLMFTPSGHLFGFNLEIQDDINWRFLNNFYNGETIFQISTQYFIDNVLSSETKQDIFINSYNKNEIPLNIEFVEKSLDSRQSLIQPFFEKVMDKARNLKTTQRKLGLLHLILSIKNSLLPTSKELSLEIIELFNLNSPKVIKQYIKATCDSNWKKIAFSFYEQMASKMVGRVNNAAVSVKMLFIETKTIIPFVNHHSFQNTSLRLCHFSNMNLLYNSWDIATQEQRERFCKIVLDEIISDNVEPRYIEISETLREKLLNLLIEDNKITGIDNYPLPYLYTSDILSRRCTNEFFKLFSEDKTLNIFNQEILKSLDKEDVKWMMSQVVQSFTGYSVNRKPDWHYPFRPILQLINENTIVNQTQLLEGPVGLSISDKNIEQQIE